MMMLPTPFNRKFDSPIAGIPNNPFQSKRTHVALGALVPFWARSTKLVVDQFFLHMYFFRLGRCRILNFQQPKSKFRAFFLAPKSLFEKSKWIIIINFWWFDGEISFEKKQTPPIHGTITPDRTIPVWFYLSMVRLGWLCPGKQQLHKLGVSKNKGTLKWMIYNGKSD